MRSATRSKASAFLSTLYAKCMSGSPFKMGEVTKLIRISSNAPTIAARNGFARRVKYVGDQGYVWEWLRPTSPDNDMVTEFIDAVAEYTNDRKPQASSGGESIGQPGEQTLIGFSKQLGVVEMKNAVAEGYVDLDADNLLRISTDVILPIDESSVAQEQDLIPRYIAARLDGIDVKVNDILQSISKRRSIWDWLSSKSK